ncbi:MAG: hypothetical protein M1838_006002 [Thelocarpon superellum]|nr:MAG: hypothetical protein M1838_006002 [Thelocarpon superellum]
MWLDRFSGHSPPSASPPRNRSYSPAPQRSVYLSPSQAPAQPRRPAFSPRSSSLSLATPASSSALDTTRPQHGSALRRSTTNTPPNVPEPLDVLAGIVGDSRSKDRRPSHVDDGVSQSETLVIAAGLVEDVDFGGLSLVDFVNRDQGEAAKRRERPPQQAQTAEDYAKEQVKFEELHSSILGCDKVLASVETYLTSFQTDLGVVSAEIETLQSRSTSLNARLENRRTVEKLLGPAVEEFSISPTVVMKVAEGPIDEAWVQALMEVDQHANAVDAKAKLQPHVKAVEDIQPLLNDMINKAVERIRDYLVTQIKSFRSPNINAQIIQRKSFVKYRELHVFLARHHPTLAEEIGQAYINTMRWYYLSHFTRYQKALDKLRLYVMDKQDVLGADELARRRRPAAAAHDPFNLGRRLDILHHASGSSLSSYLAEEDKSAHHLEVPFRNFNLALVDNASAEYAFLTDFFSTYSFHQVSRTFAEIFQPTFTLGQSLTKSLVESNVDCMGVLICVRLNQRFAFELQRRKVPAVESYINGTNMLLWPRFQIIMDLHCESVRRVAAQSSSKIVASALSLSVPESNKQSAAPHQLTQRFAQFLRGILSLSSDAGDDEPVSTSLGRLRNDFEAFLTRLSKTLAETRKRQRFLFNNYSLVVTIIQDTAGKLAQEQIEHFQMLQQAHSDER